MTLEELNDLIEWMNDPRRKPLMVWGARQVGKINLLNDLIRRSILK